MIAFGIVKPGSMLRIPFDSFAAATGAPSAVSNFAVGDILIYKDGNTTARASTTGYTATTSFSSVVGVNEAVVDLSSDATGDFYKAGSNYVVVISPVTIDGQTMAFVAATFTIGYENAVLNTSIATLASQTSFTLTTGPAEDDALNGMWAIVHDKASAVQFTWVQILDYTGSTKTVTLAAVPPATFTIAAIDNFSVVGVMPLQPTVTGTRLDVSAGGEAGVDWANLGSPTTTVGLSGTTVKTATDVEADTQDIQARLPAALTAGGKIKASMDEILAAAQSATDLKDFADDGYDPATNKVQGVVLVDATTAVNNAVVAATVSGDIQGNIFGNVEGDLLGDVFGSVASLGGVAVAQVTASVPTTAAISDKVLGRNIDGGSDVGRTVSQALSMLRNKVEIVAGTLTVYEQDNTTPMWEAAITTAAGNPLTAIAPTT